MYTVLIADDNPTICQGLLELIPWAEDQMEVVATASNGREALAILTTRPIDLLITDVKMPVMDGIDLIRNLVDRGVKTRRIILSAFSDFDYVRRAAVYGIENYLLKPVEAVELRNTLLSAIDKIQFESQRNWLEAEGAPLLRGNILARWVSGSISPNELQDKGRFLKLPLAATHYRVDLVSSSDQNPVPDAWAAVWRTSVAMSPGMDAEVFRDVPGNLVVLFSAGDAPSLARFANDAMERFRAALVVHGESFPVFRASEVVSGMELVHDAYLQVIETPEDPQTPASTSPLSRSSHLAAKVNEYIADHYRQEINLKTVAYELGMNAFYLGQIFRGSTGDSFTNRLNSLRIDAAKELLRGHDTLRVSEVATMVGYSNPNYFFTVFKKYTGVTPAAYQLGAGQPGA
ncbi:MAG: response regulator [Spirochaetales bacterium]